MDGASSGSGIREAGRDEIMTSSLAAIAVEWNTHEVSDGRMSVVAEAGGASEAESTTRLPDRVYPQGYPPMWTNDNLVITQVSVAEILPLAPLRQDDGGREAPAG